MSIFIENYNLEDLQRGYVAEGDTFCCIECGARFEQGEVYPSGDRFFEAEKAAALHAGSAHGSRFGQLLQTDSRYLNLTDNQRRLLELLYEGRSDSEIAAETGVTAATVRRQRFAFREKAKRAKMYLALYGLVEQARGPAGERLVPVHEGVKMLDDRFTMTEKEKDKILGNAFESLEPLRLGHLPVKQKKKVAILSRIAAEFEKGHDYTEKEVNAILKNIFDDYVTLRRYLIEYGYMDRTQDCSRYWVR